MNGRNVAVATGIVVVLLVLWHLNRTQSEAARDGKQAHDYLCYQKTVVIPARIASTVKYEQDVQLGLRTPIPGITTADLASSVQRDQASLRALARVNC